MEFLVNVLDWIFLLFIVIVIFNLLIFVHELGHFLAARWRGMYVDRFAVWFGKPLWSRKIGEVEYILGSVPIGGYVSLPQMADMEAIEGEVEEKLKNLPPAKPLDKIIVAFAGPLFSFLLAVVFAVAVWFVGRPISASERDLTLAWVPEQVRDMEQRPEGDEPWPLKDNPARADGFMPGDKIVKVDGIPVKRWGGMNEGSIIWRFIQTKTEKVPITVLRDGQEVELQATPYIAEKEWYQRAPLKRPSPYLGRAIQAPARVAAVMPNSPAAAVGIEKGDKLVAINGKPIVSFFQLTKFTQSFPGQAFDLTVERINEQGQAMRRDVRIQPIKYVAVGENDPRPAIGIAWDSTEQWGYDYPSPVEQVVDSVMMVVNTLSALFTPGSGVDVSHLSGPAGIINIYQRLLEANWKLVLWMSVIINVNLAILNLMPIPVLDGGHIVFAIIEMITGRPIPKQVVEISHTACVLALLSFMAYVTLFDIQECSGVKSSPKLEFPPPEEQPPQPAQKDDWKVLS